MNIYKKKLLRFVNKNYSIKYLVENEEKKTAR